MQSLLSFLSSIGQPIKTDGLEGVNHLALNLSDKSAEFTNQLSFEQLLEENDLLNQTVSEGLESFDGKLNPLVNSDEFVNQSGVKSKNNIIKNIEGEFNQQSLQVGIGDGKSSLEALTEKDQFTQSIEFKTASFSASSGKSLPLNAEQISDIKTNVSLDEPAGLKGKINLEGSVNLKESTASGLVKSPLHKAGEGGAYQEGIVQTKITDLKLDNNQFNQSEILPNVETKASSVLAAEKVHAQLNASNNGFSLSVGEQKNIDKLQVSLNSVNQKSEDVVSSNTLGTSKEAGIINISKSTFNKVEEASLELSGKQLSEQELLALNLKRQSKSDQPIITTNLTENVQGKSNNKSLENKEVFVGDIKSNNEKFLSEKNQFNETHLNNDQKKQADSLFQSYKAKIFETNKAPEAETVKKNIHQDLSNNNLLNKTGLNKLNLDGQINKNQLNKTENNSVNFRDSLFASLDSQTTRVAQTSEASISKVDGLHWRDPVQNGIQDPAVRLTSNSDINEGLKLKQDFNSNLAHRIQWIHSKSFPSAQIMMDPPELGPLSVKIQHNQGETSIIFQVNHPATRDALNDSLPRLKEMLEQQGINLSDASVEDQSGQTNRSHADDQNTDNQSTNNQLADSSESMTQPEKTQEPIQTSINLVDVYS